MIMLLHIKDFLITIVSAGYEYHETLCDKVCDDILYGLTKDNKWIIFFGCKFRNTSILRIATHVTTQGYIIMEGDKRPDANELCTQITFYSPAINEFYPSVNAYKKRQVNGKATDFSVEFKEDSEITRKIKFENFIMMFGFYFKNKYSPQSNDVLNCIPCISFKFNNTVGISELKDCYLKLTSFLSFINFNSNIPFDKIDICLKKDKQIINSGFAYINSHSESYDSRKGKAILSSSFEDEEIVSLFNQVADNNDIRKHYYTPKSVKDIHRFNHSDLLLNATCFEGLFREHHPNFKSEKNKAFKKVKEDFLSFSSQYKENDSLSKEERKYAEKFDGLINNYDGLLEEIFNSAINEFKVELSNFIMFLKNQFTVSDDNYGRLYAKIRNPYAHGDFYQLGDDEAFIYELLQALIYAMNLKAANIPQDKSRDIITKIFL